MYCSNCGNQLQDGAKFCSSCGQQATGYAEPNSQNNSYNTSAKNIDIQVKIHAGTREIIIPYTPNLTLDVLQSLLGRRMSRLEMKQRNVLGVRSLLIKNITKFANIGVRVNQYPAKGQTIIVLAGEANNTGFFTMGALSSLNLVSSDKLRVALDDIAENIKLCIAEI